MKKKMRTNIIRALRSTGLPLPVRGRIAALAVREGGHDTSAGPTDLLRYLSHVTLDERREKGILDLLIEDRFFPADPCLDPEVRVVGVKGPRGEVRA